MTICLLCKYCEPWNCVIQSFRQILSSVLFKIMSFRRGGSRILERRGPKLRAKPESRARSARESGEARSEGEARDEAGGGVWGGGSVSPSPENF